MSKVQELLVKLDDAKIDFSSILADIEDAVDRNDNWGAAIILADALKNKGAKKWLEMAQKIHNENGSLPPGLGDFRDWMIKGLKKDASKMIKDKGMLSKLQSAL